jgi:hypothetical protein
MLHRVMCLVLVVFALASELALTGRVLAEEPESKPSSGVYILTKDPVHLPRGDGTAQLPLGDKLAARFDHPALISDTNDNSHLDLSVECLLAREDERKPMAILLAGKTFYVKAMTHAGGRFYLQADVAGPEIAQAVADELNIKPKFRTHPGHQWVVSLRPDKDSYQVGDPITLTLTIKNVGQTTLSFTDGVLPPGWRNNQFEFVAFKHVGFETPMADTGNASIRVMGSTLEAVVPGEAPPKPPRPIVLKPGEEFKTDVNLGDWFKFDAPDSYRVRALYHVLLQTLDRSQQVLWDDCAVGQCTFRIDQAVGK